jgi:hypothetical protein
MCFLTERCDLREDCDEVYCDSLLLEADRFGLAALQSDGVTVAGLDVAFDPVQSSIS